MRVVALLALVLSLGMLATPAASRTWHILPDGSGDQPTIQAGLNAAASGDTVLVAAGTYHENLFWPFRNGIVLIGAGMDNTIIFGNQVDPVLYMVGTASLEKGPGEARRAFLDGHQEILGALALAVPIDSTTVIRRASFRCGGDAGVAFYGSSPVLDSCGVESTSNGPGVYCSSGSAARILRCRVEHNNGGGIKTTECDSLLVISQNLISSNSAPDYGGGICCYYSSPTILSNTLIENSAQSLGGGIFCEFSSPTIMGNTLSKNTVSYSTGGGICCYFSSPTISGNVLCENAASRGGGIACYYYCFSTISGNTLYGNVATHGGGIYCITSSPTISANSVIRNRALQNGGALYCENGSNLVFFSNTVTDNAAFGLGDALYTTSSSPTVSFSNIAHNGWGVHNASLDNDPVCQDNWWGDALGPWHSGQNPGGPGDSLNTYAWDFMPWLGEPDTTAPPIPPRNLASVPQRDGSLFLTWDGVPLGDLAGYRVHFDIDTLGYLHADSIDVGNVTAYMLCGLQSGTRYYVAVTCYDNGGNRSWYSAPDSAVAEVSTSVETATVPTAYRLGPNVPNPFNPTTTIRFSIPVAGPVALTVHDISGRRVATIAQGVYQPGDFTAVWNGKDDSGADAPSGIYFARLHAGEYVAVRKMVLLR